MLEINSILTPDRVYTDVDGVSKKKILQNIAHRISNQVDSIAELELFDRLVARERLGSTGFGQGVAMPHCRIPNFDQAIGAFFRLTHPVDFDAVDHKPVDIIFVLLVPEDATGEHLELLAKLAERFHDVAVCNDLRQESDHQRLYQLLTDS